MFTQSLTRAEREAFVQLAYHLVHVDGVLSECEEEVVAALRLETEVDTPAHAVDPLELADVFVTRRARVAVLLELMSLAHVDGSYDPSEQALVASLAGAFGFDEDDLAVLTSWVIRQTLLLREADDLLEG
jgi:uncharacterized tellurite resistance protein B-like protein